MRAAALFFVVALAACPGRLAFCNFEPDHRPRTLADVDAYIAKERHLPDVHSASDVKRNGVDLAKMQMALLQKIEEPQRTCR